MENMTKTELEAHIKSVQEANDKAFSMLREGLAVEYKDCSPKRKKMTKKEDKIFVKQQLMVLFRKRRNLDLLIEKESR